MHARRWSRRVLLTGLLLLLAGGLFRAYEAVAYDADEWVEDYEHLRAHMTGVYANLAWAAEHRGLDLAELDRRTRARIRNASSDREALEALGAFVAAFEDPHLHIEGGTRVWVRALRSIRSGGGNSGGERAPLPRDADPDTALAWFGIDSDDLSFRVGFPELDGYEPVDADASGSFPAGVLPLPDGRRLGVLRIAGFGYRFPELAKRAWSEWSAELQGDVTHDATWPFYLRLSNEILAALRAQVEALADVDLLLVDLTRNGGGTDWVDPAARMLTDKPLRGTRVSFRKHPHWSERLRARSDELARLVEAGELPPEHARLYRDALERLRACADEAARPCDAAPLWTGGPAALGCAPMVASPTYTTGALPYLPPDALPADAPLRSRLFAPLTYAYEEGLYDGPLFVLVDGGTASAAEQFAVLLRDNDACLLVGSRTLGAGCGYTNGGAPAVLPNSGVVVKMPDCARFRVDGKNEVEGLSPDVPIEWRGSAKERARSVVDALGAR